MKRNLIYSCCAFEKSEAWKENIEEICSHVRVFNGRRIIIVMTGEGIVDPAIVEKQFLFNAEFIRCTNVPELRETVGFIEALARLKSTIRDEVFFFAHTKGVTHNDKETLESIKIWREQMYRFCLGNIEQIDKILSRFACAGCFQIREPRIPLPSDALWHYSGTFWWVNHARLFSRKNWYDVHQSSHGVEAYLGRIFDIRDSYCLDESNLDAFQLYNLKKLGVVAILNKKLYECKNCGNRFEAIGGKKNSIICKKCFKRACQPI